jgi:UPF0716 protein FxsA
MGFLLFIVLPLTELWLLIEVGDEIGFWPLLGLLVASAFLGSAFAKREGLRVWTQYQEALLDGREPSEGVLEGVLVLLGGALLIVPGLLTDVLGLSLLIPWTRRWIASALRKRHASGEQVFVRHFVVRPGHPPQRGGVRRPNDVIETTGTTVDDEPPRLGG